MMDFRANILNVDQESRTSCKSSYKSTQNMVCKISKIIINAILPLIRITYPFLGLGQEESPVQNLGQNVPGQSPKASPTHPARTRPAVAAAAAARTKTRTRSVTRTSPKIRTETKKRTKIKIRKGRRKRRRLT